MSQLKAVLVLIVLSVLTACQQDLASSPELEGANGQGIIDPRKGPAHTGYVLGNDGKTPVKIQYQIVDGTAIFDGDVGIGPASEIAKSPADLKGNLQSQALRDFREAPWTNGVVPVVREITPTYLQAAVDQIESQVPGIQFVDYSGQGKYLVFRQGTGNIFKGCTGAECVIELEEVGKSKALLMHEIGHALGFAHEVRRCDRDNHINMIDTGGPGLDVEFSLTCNDANYEAMGEYDINSIMHYNSKEFFSGTDRVHFTDLNGNLVQGYWQANKLSPGDVAAWSSVYPSEGGGDDSVPGTTINQGEYTGPYNLRSGPGTTYDAVGSVNGGVNVSIVCQATGTPHTGPYGETDIWDKLDDDTWISDAFVYTGSNGTVAPTCN